MAVLKLQMDRGSETAALCKNKTYVEACQILKKNNFVKTSGGPEELALTYLESYEAAEYLKLRAKATTETALRK